MQNWHYTLAFLIIGYAIGFYFPAVGDMTIGKLKPR